MKALKILLPILTILLGALLFVYGGYDDSPGAQLLGLLISTSGVLWMIKTLKK